MPLLPQCSWPAWLSCAYAGWARVSKNWSCELFNPFTNTVYIEERRESDSEAARTTSTHYTLKTAHLCVRAQATYNDGSGGDSSEKCS